MLGLGVAVQRVVDFYCTNQVISAFVFATKLIEGQDCSGTASHEVTRSENLGLDLGQVDARDRSQ